MKKTTVFFLLFLANFQLVQCSERSVDDLLIEAVKSRNRSKVYELVLQQRADVNTVDSAFLTPLHYAVTNGMSDIVSFLIGHRAHLNAADRNRMTPLHYAMRPDRKEIARKLINAGANVFYVDRRGERPIDNAMIQELFEEGRRRAVIERGERFTNI